MRALIEDFGLAVRQLREQQGWSQEHLAAQAELNRSYVGEIERGRVTVSLVTLHKLAEALQVEPAVLLARRRPAPALMAHLVAIAG